MENEEGHFSHTARQDLTNHSPKLQILILRGMMGKSGYGWNDSGFIWCVGDGFAEKEKESEVESLITCEVFRKKLHSCMKRFGLEIMVEAGPYLSIAVQSTECSE